MIDERTPAEMIDNERGYQDGHADALMKRPKRDTDGENLDYQTGYRSGYLVGSEDRAHWVCGGPWP